LYYKRTKVTIESRVNRVNMGLG